MSDMLTSHKTKVKQKQKLLKAQREINKEAEKLYQKKEKFLTKRLSESLNINLGKIIKETEQMTAKQKTNLQPKIEKAKKKAVSFAIREKRRIDQAIKTYDKHGFIEGLHKFYPNHPHLRVKYASDWEAQQEPITPEVMNIAAYAETDFNVVPDPVNSEGHGYCREFKALCDTAIRNRRFGTSSAWTTQELTFRHDPPPAGSENYAQCAIEEVWAPLTITGISYVHPSTALFFSLSPALRSGGVTNIDLSIRVVQDTNSSPITYDVVEDQSVFSQSSSTGNWFFGGFGFNAGYITPIPIPINVTMREPYRMPILLRTDNHGGGQVRVIVTVSCQTWATYRGAEAEIDLFREQHFGVTVHEVFLKVAGYIGYGR